MSGSGNSQDDDQQGYYDPFGTSTNWFNGLPPVNNGSSIALLPYPKVGLFGGQYADMMNAQAENGTGPAVAELGAPTDFSTDGTGLPPSVTLTRNLPLLTDPAASLREVLGFTDDSLGLPSPAGSSAQLTDAMSDGSLTLKPHGPPVLTPLPLPNGQQPWNAIPLSAAASVPNNQDISPSAVNSQAPTGSDSQQPATQPDSAADIAAAGGGVAEAAASGSKNLPSIDSAFINQWEIDPKNPTVLTDPTPKNSGGYSTTGVSSGGFDFGAHSRDQINRLRLSDAGRAKVLPLAGLQGEKAQQYLHNLQDRHLSPEDVKVLHQAGLDEAVERVQRLYDKESSSGLTFSELPEPARTALTSLAYQTRDWHTSRLWRYVTSGRWNAAVNELNHYYDNSRNPPTDKDIARRKQEGRLIQGALDQGLLHNSPN